MKRINMNWYKKAEIDIANVYTNFVNVIKDQAPQYGLIFNNGAIISSSSNKIRFFISDPEERYRYVVNFRISDKKIESVILSLNSNNNILSKNYNNHDVYGIVDEILRMIISNINSVKEGVQ